MRARTPRTGTIARHTASGRFDVYRFDVYLSQARPHAGPLHGHAHSCARRASPLGTQRQSLMMQEPHRAPSLSRRGPRTTSQSVDGVPGRPLPPRGSVPVDALARERLFAQLNAAPQDALRLVCAPAGAGKTVLVGSWLVSGARRHFTWVQLSATHGRLSRFASSISEAVMGVPTDGQQASTSHLGRGRRFDVEQVLWQLRDELGRFRDPITLILDGYESVCSDPIDAFVRDLIADRPGAPGTGDHVASEPINRSGAVARDWSAAGNHAR